MMAITALRLIFGARVHEVLLVMRCWLVRGTIVSSSEHVIIGVIGCRIDFVETWLVDLSKWHLKAATSRQLVDAQQGLCSAVRASDANEWQGVELRVTKGVVQHRKRLDK
eukprot:m.55013 g.55013  ORF g.55013 m.55013 type:complete len:110 (-) comp11464_c0_seq2:90-419(-)